MVDVSIRHDQSGDQGAWDSCNPWLLCLASSFQSTQHEPGSTVYYDDDCETVSPGSKLCL